jgi:FkbM family methyltransferase
MNKVLNLKKLVEKYDMKIRGVVHIGAHFGRENRLYRELGINNRMYFEPQKSSYQMLRWHLGNRYPLFNKALGNENRKAILFTESANKGQSSSILKPVLHLKQYPQIVFDGEEEVEMARLDDLGLDLTNYNFISIDVQGYELEVFKGAAKTLENIDYIISEINREEVYQNCAKVGQLVEFLNPYGFVLVEESWKGGGWGDGLFIKQK